jgi:O-antigen ligase
VIILSFRRYRQLLWIGLAIVFIIISALILLPHHGLEVDRFKLGDPQFISSRDVIYRGAAQAFTTVPPTGFGPGSFQSAFPLTNRFHNPVEQIGGWHNDILQAFLEGGLLTLVAYLWMMLTAIAAIYRGAALSDDPWMRGGRWGIAIATAGVGISALLCNVATVPMVIIGQTMLWGLVMGRARPEELIRA